MDLTIHYTLQIVNKTRVIVIVEPLHNKALFVFVSEANNLCLLLLSMTLIQRQWHVVVLLDIYRI